MSEALELGKNESLAALEALGDGAVDVTILPSLMHHLHQPLRGV